MPLRRFVTLFERDRTDEASDSILVDRDSLTYGAIVSVCIGRDEAITTPTDHGIEELTAMLVRLRRRP